jgi:hypothetical protein
MLIFAPVKKLPSSFLWILGSLTLITVACFGQDNPVEADTIATKQLDEVIVTATRNERTVGALPMPV